jgi:hypothetical protein
MGLSVGTYNKITDLISGTPQTFGTDYEHSFYAAGRYWVFYTDNGSLYYQTSLDTVTWTAAVTICGQSADNSFGIHYDGTFGHYARNDSGMIYYRRFTPNSDGTVTYSDVEQSCVNALYWSGQQVAVTTDSSGHPYIIFQSYDGYSNYYSNIFLISSPNTDGTFPAVDHSIWLSVDNGGWGDFPSCGFAKSPTGFLVLTCHNNFVRSCWLDGSHQTTVPTVNSGAFFSVSGITDNAGTVYAVTCSRTDGSNYQGEFLKWDISTGWHNLGVVCANAGGNVFTVTYDPLKNKVILVGQGYAVAGGASVGYRVYNCTAQAWEDTVWKVLTPNTGRSPMTPARTPFSFMQSAGTSFYFQNGKYVAGQLYDHYNTNDDSITQYGVLTWAGQNVKATFSPVPYILQNVRLKLGKGYNGYGDYTTTVSIRHTKTGADLCSGTILPADYPLPDAGSGANCDYLDCPMSPPIIINPNEDYVICVRAPNTDYNFILEARIDSTSPTYGHALTISVDGGASWTDYGFGVLMFEFWGIPAPAKSVYGGIAALAEFNEFL